jgi:hypothetical protein
MSSRRSDVWFYDPARHRAGIGSTRWCSNCHKRADTRYRKAAFTAEIGPARPGGRMHTLALCDECLGSFILRHRPHLHLDPKPLKVLKALKSTQPLRTTNPRQAVRRRPRTA